MVASKASVLFGFFVGQAAAGSWGSAWPSLRELKDPSMPVVGHGQLPGMSNGARRLQSPMSDGCKAVCSDAADYFQKMMDMQTKYAGSGGVPSTEAQVAMMEETYSIMCEYPDTVACIGENQAECGEGGNMAGGMDGQSLQCYCKVGYFKAATESVKYRDDPLKASCAIVPTQITMFDEPACANVLTQMQGGANVSLEMLKMSMELSAKRCEDGGSVSPTPTQGSVSEISCEDIAKEYEMQGCCGNPRKTFTWPKSTVSYFCGDVKDTYKRMQCCSKTATGGSGSSGGLSQEQSLEQMKQVYRDGDKDKDGRLSMDEFIDAGTTAAGFADVDAFAAAGGTSKEDFLKVVAEAFRKVDENEDGFLSMEEVDKQFEPPDSA